MKNTREIKKMYEEAKEKAITKLIKDSLTSSKRPHKFKLIGKPREYITYYSNSAGGEVSRPSDWPVCYLQYTPDPASVTLKFRCGYGIYDEHVGVFHEGEIEEWNSKKNDWEYGNSQYSIKQMNKALRTLKDKGFNLEKVLSQISRVAGSKSK